MSRVERRLRRRRRRRGVLVMGALLAVVGAVVFQALQWSAAREQGSAVPPGREVTITVASGQSSVEIGRNLRDAGVVDSVNRFRDVAEERGLDSSLKPGEYKLVTGMSIDAVLDILARGPSTGVPLTIPERFTVAQIVAKLAATEQFTKAEVDKALESKDLIVKFRPKGETSLEGLLFPDTYGIEEDDSAVDVLQDMLNQLETVLAKYELSTAPQGLDAYQLLTVASMIEREAKVDGDRPKIAAVIYNRLAAGKRLEIDATVEYAVGHAKLTAKDLKLPSPYNTYISGGLPPTPIAAPGEAAIKAALQPAEGDWIYYVLATEEGEHAFTNSYEEFLDLKAQARAKGLL
ncbi:MAG TPA: endolytic transglycosylase MltG [Actinomycetota bacterium]|nr:endolytic transglycosylase MltG [Actinomycetota bacterium]